MKSSLRVFLVVILILIAFRQSFVHAYDDEVVHPVINENAALQSNVDNVIKEQLGLSGGLYEIFQGTQALKWLQKGGKLEDEGVRYLRHFHDPLKPWEDAGLNLWFVPGNYPSSLLWAQGGQSFLLDGKYSWEDAREYYYQALTSGSEIDYAQTFRTLGQIMHLVADASVPAHVRNDGHGSFDIVNGMEESRSGLYKNQ